MKDLLPALFVGLMLSLLFPTCAFAGRVDCQALSAGMTDHQAYVRPPQGLRVIGPARLHFHTAPDPDCGSRVFVITDDVLIAYAAWKNWFFVQYTNKRSGKISSGWIDESGVEVTGAVGMDSEVANPGRNSAKEPAALPADVSAMVERLGLCTHFAGEFNGDQSEHDRKVNATMTELRCDSAEAEAAGLRRRYPGDRSIRDALDQATEP